MNEDNKELFKQLLDQSTKNKESDGKNQLYVACKYNYKNTVEFLLQEDLANLDEKYEEDNSPLHIACQYGCTDIANLLIEKGMDINSVNQHKWTPLHMACEHKKVEVVKTLLSHGADITMQTDQGKTALHIVCENNDTKTAKFLLKHKAVLSIKDHDGNLPIHIACQKGYEGMVKELLKRKYHRNLSSARLDMGVEEAPDIINEPNGKGFTLLHIACQRGSMEMIKYLLKHKADIDAQTPDNKTVLHMACEQRNLFLVRYLLSENANIYIKTSENKTALHISCENGEYEIVSELLERAHVLNDDTNFINIRLFNNDKSQSTKQQQKSEDNGMTALHIACEKGFVDVVRVLLYNKINIVDKTSNLKLTALHIACKNSKNDSNKEIVSELLNELISKYSDKGEPIYHWVRPCHCTY